ncbi:MAG: heme exporter protein CcmB [Chloroflexota bacterium]|nr:heme exporter protein CcmB [Chloroflexota bacterium]MDE3102794.1 heme exporter protein CcmB [Chloroflexota bacterium]
MSDVTIGVARRSSNTSGPKRAWLVAAREVRADLRQPDGLIAGVTFMAVLVLLESLIVGPQTARQSAVAPALYWVALLFAAIVTTTRSFDRELEDDAIDAVLALPGGADALYAGKLIALAGSLVVVALVGGLLEVVFLDLAVPLPLQLVVATLLGVLALPPIVVLDVALTLRLRARAALVPILALPVLVPQLVAGTNAVSAALSGDPSGSLGWSGLLLAAGLAYTAAGIILVPTAIE